MNALCAWNVGNASSCLILSNVASNLSNRLSSSLTQEGYPGSYSVSPGYYSNSTSDWAQLSSSSRLGPTDCTSPAEPEPSGCGPCPDLIGTVDEQWS